MNYICLPLHLAKSNNLWDFQGQEGSLLVHRQCCHPFTPMVPYCTLSQLLQWFWAGTENSPHPSQQSSNSIRHGVPNPWPWQAPCLHAACGKPPPCGLSARPIIFWSSTYETFNPLSPRGQPLPQNPHLYTVLLQQFPCQQMIFRDRAGLEGERINWQPVMRLPVYSQGLQNHRDTVYCIYFYCILNAILLHLSLWWKRKQ